MWLFRGKQTEDGPWEESPSAEGLVTDGKCHNFLPETVGIFTSVTDRSGRKIFTNDIILIRVRNENYLGVVRFGRYQELFGYVNGGHIGFYVEWMTGRSRDLLRVGLGFWNDKANVVGNIIDNKIDEAEGRLI